jgi:membrane-bound lytic murein transglycosylase A
LARPDDLVSAAPGQTLAGLESGLSAGRARADGTFAPYPERAAIEAGAIAGHTKPLVWLRDKVEVFLIQVQGSARVRLADGRVIRLVYAGRNGQPYSSIGRILVAEGHVPPEGIGMERLKSWIRTQGQGEQEPGGRLMARNKSYVFFAIDQSLPAEAGPIGGAGLALTPLRSLAIDRAIWPYGLPVWIDADMPWQGAASTPMRRLMVAQDTGSAILGPSRADIFFGSGDAAGLKAGEIRHKGAFIVFWPRDEGNER